MRKLQDPEKEISNCIFDIDFVAGWLKFMIGDHDDSSRLLLAGAMYRLYIKVSMHKVC